MLYYSLFGENSFPFLEFQFYCLTIAELNLTSSNNNYFFLRCQDDESVNYHFCKHKKIWKRNEDVINVVVEIKSTVYTATFWQDISADQQTFCLESRNFFTF